MNTTVTTQDVRTVFRLVPSTSGVAVGRQLAVVWCPRNITCCPGHPGWEANVVPREWDPTGQGDWEVCSLQCEGCGSMIRPVSRVLVDPSDGELVQARILVADEQRDVDAVQRSRVILRLRESLHLTRQEIRELPDLDAMTGPGVGMDVDGNLVAWDYDPTHPGYPTEIISERRWL